MTVAAKRLGDGTDQPDLAAPVAITIARGHLAPIRRSTRFQRPACTDPADDLPRRHDAIGGPVVRVANVHELDEPQRMTVGPEILAQLQQLAVIHAPLHDTID